MKNFFKVLFFRVWFFFNYDKPYWLLHKEWCLYRYKEEWVIVKKGTMFKDALYWGEDLIEGLRLLEEATKLDGWDYGGGVDDPRY